MAEITKEELKKLSLPALVAFAARCAERVWPLFEKADASDGIKLAVRCPSRNEHMRPFGYVVLLFAFGALLIGCGPSPTTTEQKVVANYKKMPKVETDKIDAHQFKDDEVGPDNIAKYDIFWDTSETNKDNRKIRLEPKQSGGDLGIHETSYIWSGVKRDYPAS